MTSTTFYTYTPTGEQETVCGPFDDMTAHDRMADRNGAVKGEAFWSTGIVGTAIAADGSDGHAMIPDADCLTPGNTMSLSFWVNWGGSQRTGIYKYARGASSRAYYLEVRSDGKVDGVVFSGDALFNMSIGRTDGPSGNYNLLISSIRSKLLILPDETVVLPGHGPRTTIGWEKQHNPFLR